MTWWSWMQRLKRMFAINIESCPECGGKLRVVACIQDPSLIIKILSQVRGVRLLTFPPQRTHAQCGHCRKRGVYKGGAKDLWLSSLFA